VTSRVFAVLAFIVCTSLAAAAQAQQSVADFYKGKQIKFIIRSTPGGGYDLYTRILGAHLVRHIPGTPTMLPQNMPGAGGMTATNYMVDIAPRDGTILTILSQALPMDQALGYTPTLKADLRTFGYIGNLNDSNMLAYTTIASPTKTMADAKRRETLMGGVGAADVAAWLPLIFNSVIGTKFKVVNGYQSGTEVKLAMERGEVEGYGANPWSALQSASADLIRNHQLSILVQVGVKKEKDLPNVPLLVDLAETDEQRAILDFIGKAFAVGRPIATTPGVPPERMAALRKAFDDTLADPAFLADMKKAGADIGAMDGATTQKMVEEVLATPQALKDKVRAVMPERS
jgi:tripartite-type tricarboxylate transporter receptor subunit TctC